MKRKDFIRKFAVGGSILLTAPMLFNSCDKEEDPTNNNNNNNTGNPNEIVIDLTAAGSAALKTIGGYIYSGNIIVFRTGDTSYMALSKLCTHSQCTITYNHSNNELPCPCHGSKFDTSGKVTNGPAKSALKKYSVTLDGNSLKIT